MPATLYPVEEARRLIGYAGMIARVSATGNRLVVYEGEEDFPGTWSEVDATGIRNGMVSGNFIDLVTR